MLLLLPLMQLVHGLHRMALKTPGPGTNSSAGFITPTAIAWDPTLPLNDCRAALKGTTTGVENEAYILSELEMSHYYLSTLKIKGCYCFIEPDSVIKMEKKQVVCITGVWLI